MRNRPIIHIDSEDGKRLGLTSQFFVSGMVYDIRPKMFAVVNLYPTEHAQAGYKCLLDALNSTVTPCEIVAPDTLLTEMAMALGWKKETRPEGTIIVHNRHLKPTWILEQKVELQPATPTLPGKGELSDSVLSSLFDK